MHMMHNDTTQAWHGDLHTDEDVSTSSGLWWSCAVLGHSWHCSDSTQIVPWQLWTPEGQSQVAGSSAGEERETAGQRVPDFLRLQLNLSLPFGKETKQTAHLMPFVFGTGFLFSFILLCFNGRTLYTEEEAHRKETYETITDRDHRDPENMPDCYSTAGKCGPRTRPILGEHRCGSEMVKSKHCLSYESWALIKVK